MACFVDFTKIFRLSMHMPLYAYLSNLTSMPKIGLTQRGMLSSISRNFLGSEQCWLFLIYEKDFALDLIEYSVQMLPLTFKLLFVGFTNFFRLSPHVPLYAAGCINGEKYVSNESVMNVKNRSYPTRNAVIDFTEFFGNKQ